MVRTCGECTNCENDPNYCMWGKCIAPVPVIALRNPHESLNADVMKGDAQAEWCEAFRQKEASNG
jgi:hypothetical protein